MALRCRFATRLGNWNVLISSCQCRDFVSKSTLLWPEMPAQEVLRSGIIITITPF